VRRIEESLARLDREHLYRRRRIAGSPQAPSMQIDGRRVVTFCSNDYLGLADHPELIAAVKAGADTWGVGTGAAHLINGHTRAHEALEEELAAFVERPRALLFSTGYMANLGVAVALTEHHDLILEDRLNHASLVDAGRLAMAKMRRYSHANVTELEGLLSRHSGGDCLVMTDGVFSMDGDIAPLPAIAACCADHGAWLMVDDAHGLGVVGQGGRGSLEHHGMSLDQAPILVGTLGKALGTFGAFVAGDEALIEFLVQTARSFIYTTAPPAALAEATRAALRIVKREPERRARLFERVAQFRRGAEELSLPLLPSQTPIQPIVLGSKERALQASERLLEAGLLVTAIRPPTVPEGSARLRVTLSAAHSPEQVERLLELLGEACAPD
jgi:8-amino-7-oxononanoate synthase